MDRTLFDHLDRRRSIDERFRAFHAANPAVYEKFKEFAREARAARGHYSADAIMHRIRWWTTVETRGDDFKCNNDFSSRYARLLIAEDAEFAGFFELRELRTA